MDAPCKIQGSIHVFRLVNNMCPGKWVHITDTRAAFYMESRFFIDCIGLRLYMLNDAMCSYLNIG